MNNSMGDLIFQKLAVRHFMLIVGFLLHIFLINTLHFLKIERKKKVIENLLISGEGAILREMYFQKVVNGVYFKK